MHFVMTYLTLQLRRCIWYFLWDHHHFYRLLGLREALWVVSLGLGFLLTLAWCSVRCSPRGCPPSHPVLPQGLLMPHSQCGGLCGLTKVLALHIVDDTLVVRLGDLHRWRPHLYPFIVTVLFTQMVAHGFDYPGAASASL